MAVRRVRRRANRSSVRVGPPSAAAPQQRLSFRPELQGQGGPNTVLSREEAELEVIARGTGLTFRSFRAGASNGIEAIGFKLRGGCHGGGISLSAPM